jgi:L-histidine N-alpha-methyltransferase
MERVYARKQKDAARVLLRSLPGGSGADLGTDVRQGLNRHPKALPPKYFYDERGSRLFDQICQTPEYYPTRTEDALLARVATDIVHRSRPALIVELGSGIARKTRHLLDACERLGCPGGYAPIDVCAEVLLESGQALIDRYPWLTVEAWCGDYAGGLRALPPAPGPRLFAFLGGTIGNYDEDEALSFLRDMRAAMAPEDALLLGADRVKDPDVLHAAYNDGQGLTAAFNLNILAVINRELQGRFDLGQFSHRAGYDEARSRIEMHLDARCNQAVPIDGLGMVVRFQAGESVRTEISRKFTRDTLAALLGDAGFECRAHYEPDNGYFSLMLAAPARNSD